MSQLCKLEFIQYAECHFAECHYAECRGANFTEELLHREFRIRGYCDQPQRGDRGQRYRQAWGQFYKTFFFLTDAPGK